MENFDPEMMFPPSEEKIKVRNQVINESAVNFGIIDGSSIIHFGFKTKHYTFSSYANKKFKDIEYLGVDINNNNPDNSLVCPIKFEVNTMQSKIDECLNESKKYDWVIISGILDNNTYKEDQYDFVDSIIRSGLEISNLGLIIFYNTKRTLNDEYYNVEYLHAYINSMFNRFIINRINEETYLFCIYNKYW